MQFFAEKDGGTFIGFDLIIHKFMFGPLGLTGAEPKLNFVSAIFSEEGVYCRSNQDEHVLKRISFGFKDFLCCSNGIGDNNDIVDMSQTSFGHISINSSSILTVSMATESP